MNFLAISSKIILILSLLAVELLGCSHQLPSNSLCDFKYPPLDTVITSHTEYTKTHYPERIREFMKDPLSDGDIIMLGNSLTEHGEDWASKLDNKNVKNRGIKGDNTYGILARVNEIICAEPSKVFLMIGTNDLWLPDTPEQIITNIEKIVSQLNESENTVLFVQTIMPVEKGHEMANKIDEVNRILRSMNHTGFILIDTNLAMANQLGELPKKYTTDGVHLTPTGYEKWSSILKPYINQ